MPNLVVIQSIVSLYLCGFNCKGWVWEIGEWLSMQWRSMQLCENLTRSLWVKEPTKRPRVKHITRSWRVMSAYHSVSTCKKGYLVRYPRNSLFGKNEKCFPIFFTHTIYTLIIHEIVRSHFQRENPNKTLES